MALCGSRMLVELKRQTFNFLDFEDREILNTTVCLLLHQTQNNIIYSMTEMNDDEEAHQKFIVKSQI